MNPEHQSEDAVAQSKRSSFRIQIHHSENYDLLYIRNKYCMFKHIGHNILWDRGIVDPTITCSTLVHPGPTVRRLIIWYVMNCENYLLTALCHRHDDILVQNHYVDAHVQKTWFSDADDTVMDIVGPTIRITKMWFKWDEDTCQATTPDIVRSLTHDLQAENSYSGIVGSTITSLNSELITWHSNLIDAIT